MGASEDLSKLSARAANAEKDVALRSPRARRTSRRRPTRRASRQTRTRPGSKNDTAAATDAKGRAAELKAKSSDS
jgi:hypothetical protein